MQSTFSISIQGKPRGAVTGLVMIRFSLSIYTDTPSLVPFVGWKGPVQMVQKRAEFVHSLPFCNELQQELGMSFKAYHVLSF